MPDFRIEPEFRDLLPPLTDDERERLLTSINTDGCREPLVVWAEQGILLDGHNRYAICNDVEKPFTIVRMSFADANAAKMWMFRNQLGRRNLTPFQRAEIALLMKPVVAAQAKERYAETVGRPTDKESVQNSAPISKPQKTREIVAKIAGVSHDTMWKVEAIQQNATPEVIQAVRAKEMSIDAAFKTVTPPKPEPSLPPLIPPGPPPMLEPPSAPPP